MPPESPRPRISTRSPVPSSSSRPPPSTRAAKVSAALLILAMLCIPIAVLLVGRSLVPDLSWLGSLAASPVVAPSAAASSGVDLLATIHGRVVDSDGNLVAGAAVHLVSANPPYELLGEARSDGAGRFAFPGLRPPLAHVIADREPDGAVTSSEILAADGPSEEMLLVLSAAEAIRGVVVDEEDHPVPGASVSPIGLPWTLPAATTGPDGTFALVAVPHQATTLVAVARGYKTVRVPLDARLQASAPAETNLRVRLVSAPPIQGDVLDPDGRGVSARVIACEGEPTEAQASSAADGEFELPPSTLGCTVTAQHADFAPSNGVAIQEGRRVTLQLRAGGGIEGVVVDERAMAVTPVRVGVESFTAGRVKSAGKGGARSFDDAHGAFHLENLAPGSYVLTASAAGKPPTRSESIEVASGAVTRGVRIVLAAGGVVVGHVVDDAHAPVEGVDLSFDQVSSVVPSNAHTRTDGSGAFRLEGAPSGSFTLRASKGGFRMRLMTGLRVESGATLPQDITLSRVDGGGGLELGGIGATIERARDGIAFANVFSGDPADKAGLRSGDRILKIDGEATDAMSLADVLQRLRGEPGTTVGVSVQRGAAGAAETVDAVVVRALVVH